MTQKEYNEAVRNIIDEYEKGNRLDPQLNNEIREKATSNLLKLESRNSRPSKTQIENTPIKDNIMFLLTEEEEFLTASIITERYNINYETDYSSSKISSLCSQLAKEGKLIIDKVKSDTKSKGKINAYKIP